MNRRYIVQLLYGKRIDKQWAFATESEAIQFYNSKIGAIKYGLVGFTLTFPRLETDNCGGPV